MRVTPDEVVMAALLKKLGGKVTITRDDLFEFSRGTYEISRIENPGSGVIEFELVDTSYIDIEAVVVDDRPLALPAR